MIRIDTDKGWGSLEPLLRVKQSGGELGALPRKTLYGSAPGLKPLGDYPDIIIPKDSIKEVIQRCHNEMLFPVYHQKNTWAPDGLKWYQNGLNYCWAWSATSDLMNRQAVEGKRDSSTEILAPVTMGKRVGWKNKGNYLEDGIRALIEDGVAPASYVPNQHSRDYKNYKDGWEDAALLNRIPEDSVWDLDPDEMLLHSLTILEKGVSLYGGWNELGHAMSVVGLIWDESVYNNVIVLVRNSHGETEPIEMTGRNALPDYAYGIHATLNV